MFNIPARLFASLFCNTPYRDNILRGDGHNKPGSSHLFIRYEWHEEPPPCTKEAHSAPYRVAKKGW